MTTEQLLEGSGGRHSVLTSFGSGAGGLAMRPLTSYGTSGYDPKNGACCGDGGGSQTGHGAGNGSGSGSGSGYLTGGGTGLGYGDYILGHLFLGGD